MSNENNKKKKIPFQKNSDKKVIPTSEATKAPDIHSYLVSYFGSEGNGNVFAGTIELNLNKKITLTSLDTITDLKVLMVQKNKNLINNTFGIMGIIPIGREI